MKKMMRIGTVCAVCLMWVCGVASARDPADDFLPILPEPQQVQYGARLLDIGAAEICATCESETLRAQLQEIADEWGVPLTNGGSVGPGVDVRIVFGSRDDGVDGEEDQGEQGYRLKVFRRGGRVQVEISGGDEAGAFYALQSLRQLFVRKEGQGFLRPAVIRDWPSIRRRGLIFGAGAETESILKTLKLCSQLKLNFFQELEVRPELTELADQIRACKRFCDSHFIEQCALLGYQDFLTKMSKEQLLEYYEERYRIGFRSFTVNFDDTRLKTVKQAEALANKHSDIVNAVYRHLRNLDPDVRFIFCPIPYGGRPDTSFCFATIDAGKSYLRIMGDRLPQDVDVFWTGDGGVWSSNVTAEGAEAFGEVLGRKSFMWDNNPIRFANERLPLSGRDSDLYTELSGYVANLNEGETKWRPDRNVEFTLITSAMYTWNPEKYDSDQAAEYATRLLSKLYD